MKIPTNLSLTYHVYLCKCVQTNDCCPVSWGSRIPPASSLQRGKTNECPGYDTKQSGGDVAVMLEIWGMRSTPSLPSVPGPLWHGVVAPDKGPIYGLNRTKPWFELNVFFI